MDERHPLQGTTVFLVTCFPHFEKRVAIWSNSKPYFWSPGYSLKWLQAILKECFEKRHVLENHYLKLKEKLLLKHMYDYVPLLNDISRNVHNIDYTRDMSREEYFWIFMIFHIFMDFISFIFFYFSFWFYNLYTRIQISLRGCWHEY